MYPTFFLSHSTKDVRLVGEFINLLYLGMNLREEDIFCTSQDAIKIGEPYIDVIRTNFNASKIVIMLITKNYLSSTFCLAELGAAWASDKTMLPILVNVDYRDIEYPSTPLKATQVGNLQSKETLTWIYDLLKDNRIISAKTISFNNQLDAFMKLQLWENPVGSTVSGLATIAKGNLMKSPPTVSGLLAKLPPTQSDKLKGVSLLQPQSYLPPMPPKPIIRLNKDKL